MEGGGTWKARQGKWVPGRRHMGYLEGKLGYFEDNLGYLEGKAGYLKGTLGYTEGIIGYQGHNLWYL